LLFMVLFICQFSFAQNPAVEEQSLPAPVVNKVTTIWQNKGLGRYMEEHCEPNPVTNWLNWEGFELRRCTYSRENKSVTVIMLNPSRELLIKWAVASCVIRNHKTPSVSNQVLVSCADNLMKSILLQSGSQFPVAGIVWEPPFYSFRDGLTVELNLSPYGQWTKPMTTNYQDASLNPNFEVRRFGARARINSTTRDQYRAFEIDYLNRDPAQTTDTVREKYLPVIRGLYQSAWKRASDQSTPETVGKYRNDLLVASLY